MPRSTRPRFALLFVVAVIALAAAGSVLAETPVSKLNEWKYFSSDGIGHPTDVFSVTLPEPGYLIVTDAWCPGSRFRVTINGQDAGQTSVPSIPYTCETRQWSDNFDVALSRTTFSHGVFPLPAGKSTFQMEESLVNVGTGAGFKIGLGVYIDAALAARSGLKVITAKGKVATRAEAVTACASQGMDLADVTAANWQAVVSAVRTSTALSITPSDAVVIASWNGDSYGGSNLQLTVRTDASGTITNAGVTLLTAARYPLCQPPKETPLPGTPAAVQHSGDLAVVGPAGKVQFASRMCHSLGVDYEPMILSGAQPDEFKTASTLAFNAAGANSQVWVGGWEEPATQALVLATGSAAGAGSVVVPDNPLGEKLYLCKKTV